MLVLQPRISTSIDWTGGLVAVSVDTLAGVVEVREGVALVTGVTDEAAVAFPVIGMMGVGLTIPGVREGMGVQTGKGSG